MELSKNYGPLEVEQKWTEIWEKHQYFKSEPDGRKPYTIVIPPPNVTGVLHMGHTLNETVQDILARRARMQGYNVCWVPGSDHASIATEAKVVDMLKREKKIDKKDLSRQEFLQYAFEWKEKYGNIIYDQIRKLGCSVDWDRVTFTMDDHYYEAVIKVFIDLYEKGLIYRGARMINWDTEAKTALSDEEVEYKDVTGELYYIKYPIVGGNAEEYITIATQRPETIMGDVAVCANPNDDRYTKYKGKKVLVPLINREVPIIFDEYVDPAFGTGILKITPAHDINDFNIGLAHHLPVIDTLTDEGKLSEAAQIFVGMDRFEARKKVIEEIKQNGGLVKSEQYNTRLGYSQRTQSVVEPKISTQWFVKMSEMVKPALSEVANGNISIHPKDKFTATYKYWLENVKDWCISRQLWWGQQIPAWYDADGKFVVAENESAAIKKYRATYPDVTEVRLRQDEDVLDTWFSSWLWPIEVFKGITQPGNQEINYYYPTSVLVTGQDIIFFWVARMIMAGMEYMNEKPFSDVYFTGMVRDKLGRKMSKSLGNSPDLLQLIDQYGADAVRFGIMIAAPAGNDLLFDESSLEQGRHFNNKLWNALKLVSLWKEKMEADGEKTIVKEADYAFATEWFEHRLNESKKEVTTLFEQFKLSEALKVIYSLVWDDFCSWYLEWIKPEFGSVLTQKLYDQTVSFFEELLQLLHPFIPFITEEMYSLLKERTEHLSVQQIHNASIADTGTLQAGKQLQELISGVRDVRQKNQIKPKEKISLFIETEHQQAYTLFEQIFRRQVNAEKISFDTKPDDVALSIVVGKDRIYIQSEAKVDTAVQVEKLNKDLAHFTGFLQSIQKKLQNEKFVANARPEVIALEQKKQADAEKKIEMIRESLAALENK